MPWSNSAADGPGLEWLGSCIAGLKQPSASWGETTEAVALRSLAQSALDDCFLVSSILSSATSH